MLAILGFAMVISFMVLIMTKRLSAVPALILVPLVFALFAGAGADWGKHILDGVKQVTPTAVMLVFAVLYFGLMIDAGLFDPIVRKIVGWVGNDPLKLTVGHVLLASVVALDGDGTTTLLVCVSALLPIYRRLGVSLLVFATLGGLCSTLMNLSPWAGPTARVASALKVEPSSLFVPLLPAIGAGLVCTLLLSVHFGRMSRKHARAVEPSGDELVQNPLFPERDADACRPRLLWFNLLLTIVVLLIVSFDLAPLLSTFMVAFAIALVVNYPKMADQRTRLQAHAGNVFAVAAMVFAAGAFTGLLSGSGMVNAMAKGFVSVLPEAAGPYLASLTALASMPLTFFMSNDAFYFGVVPVIAEAAKAYGITPEQIGRASLLGQPVHGLSPLVAAVYLKCAILGIELGDYQRFALKWTVGISLVAIVAALLVGAI